MGNYMKSIKIIFLLVLVSFYYSCSDENNPIVPVDANSFFGNIGTERVYKETFSWFNPISNNPYFSVPDSLLSKVSLSSTQLDQGICAIRDYTEIISQIDDGYYYSWNLTFPKSDYLQTASHGFSYSLSDELDSLLLNKTYSPGNFGIGDEIFRKSNEGIMTVTFAETSFPSVPYLKNNLQINDNWIRYKFVDSVGNSIAESIAKVNGILRVTVPAGTFNAYKITTTTYHYNPNYDFLSSIEYYVPNVGLILVERDILLSQWDSSTGTTISFRETSRKELISYNFIP